MKLRPRRETDTLNPMANRPKPVCKKNQKISIANTCPHDEFVNDSLRKLFHTILGSRTD